MGKNRRCGSKSDYFLDVKPLITNKACGDVCIIKEFEHKLFIGIIDVAGHGEEAYDIAVITKKFLQEYYQKDLDVIMKGLHEHIKGTRGAVVGLFLLDLSTGILKYVVVGNITARIFGVNTARVVAKAGIVGYVIPTLREEETKLFDNDVLLLYTDGIKEHFELEDYPELLQDDARTIVTNVFNKFDKKNDDSACIALRFTRME